MTYTSDNRHPHEHHNDLEGRPCSICHTVTSNGKSFGGRWYCNKCIAINKVGVEAA